MKTTIKTFVSVSALFLLISCGSSSSSSPAPAAAATSTKWTNTSMQTLVASNCAISGCHAGTQTPNYATITEAQMKLDTVARDRVAAGTMPQAGVLGSADKATFAAFYK